MEIDSRAPKEKKPRRSGLVRFRNNNSNFAPGIPLTSTPTAEPDYWSGAAEDADEFPGVAPADLQPLPYTVSSSDPFSGFGGHLFLFFCWVAAILTGSKMPRPAPFICGLPFRARGPGGRRPSRASTPDLDADSGSCDF